MLVSGQGSFFFFFGRHPLLEGVGIQQPAPAIVKSSHQPPMSTLQPSNRPGLRAGVQMVPPQPGIMGGGRFPVPEDRTPPRGGGKNPEI